MISCPDKNSTRWKTLVSSVGEDIGYLLWNEYQGNIPKDILKTPTKEELDNALLKEYDKILGSVEYQKQMLQPNSDARIKKVCLDMKTLTSDNILQPADLLGVVYHVSNKQGAQLGKNVLGQAALHSTYHILSQIADLKVKNSPFDIDYLKDKEDNTKTSLAKFRSQDGILISDTISELVNALVDVLKEPYIKYSGITEHNAAAFFYMIRQGVNLEDVVYFFNHPIIKAYNEEIAKSQFDSTTYNSKLHENTVNKLISQLPSELKVRQTLSTKKTKNLKYLTEEDSKEYAYTVITQFDKMFKAGNAVNDFMRISKFDTSGVGTSIVETKTIINDYYNFVRTNKLLENWENFFEQDGKLTALGAYRDVVFDSVNYFNDLYTSLRYEGFNNNLELIEQNAKRKNKVIVSSRYKNHFAAYIVQNFLEFPKYLNIPNQVREVRDGNKVTKEVIKTIPEQISKIIKSKNNKLKDNLFLNRLLLDTSDSIHKLLLQNGGNINSIDADSLASSFREIIHYNEPLGVGIIKTALLQDGFSKSPYSLLQVVPLEYKSELTEVFYSIIKGLDLQDYDTKFKINNYQVALKRWYPKLGEEQSDNTFLYTKKGVIVKANGKSYLVNEGKIESGADTNSDYRIGRSNLDYRDSILGTLIKPEVDEAIMVSTELENRNRVKINKCNI
jgi:hypothetical protein